MVTVFWMIVWIISTILSYLIARYAHRKKKVPWTIGTRNFYIVLDIAGGPFALFSTLIVYSDTFDYFDKESKW